MLYIDLFGEIHGPSKTYKVFHWHNSFTLFLIRTSFPGGNSRTGPKWEFRLYLCRCKSVNEFRKNNVSGRLKPSPSPNWAYDGYSIIFEPKGLIPPVGLAAVPVHITVD